MPPDPDPRAPAQPPGPVTPAQVGGLTDMDPEEFRASGHRVVDLLADYLAAVERYAVLPPVEPGDLRRLLAPSPPDEPEAVD